MQWLSASRIARALGRVLVGDSTDASLEALEQRVVLYASPFFQNLPTLDLMDDPNNTVLRMQTDLGIIDIELYDRSGPNGGSRAQLTVANFLSYVERGLLDQSFFHRLVKGFVLQGGGFYFDDQDGVSSVPTDPPVNNEFSPDRSNIARTVAMAKVGGDPNSATSQFFFNLVNNSGNLDSQNGGFTVFGRVIQGWEVVLAIADLPVQDVRSVISGPFNEVPIQDPTNPPTVTEAKLVDIIDVDVIKPRDSQLFYTEWLYHPEGFASATAINTLHLLNGDVNRDAQYQVIARFEDGRRDRVVATGTLIAGARTVVRISDFNQPGNDLLRRFTPYSIEVRSTTILAGSMERFDFGGVTREELTPSAPFSEANLRTWGFTDVRQGPNLRTFLVWQNLLDRSGTVTVRIYDAAGPVSTINVPIEAYRRGGMNVAALTALPTGLYSVQIESTVPIFASMSKFDTLAADGDASNGVVNGAGTEGILAAAQIPTNGTSSVTIHNPNLQLVRVFFDFRDDNGTLIAQANRIINVVRRAEFSVQSLEAGLPQNTPFSITYRAVLLAGGAPIPVAVHYTETVSGRDRMSTPFAVAATRFAYLTGLRYDQSSGYDEIISLANPFTDTNNLKILSYQIRFHFSASDSQDEVFTPTIGGSQGFLLAAERLDFRVADLVALLPANDALRLRLESDRDFSVSIEAANFASGAAIVVQHTRYHPAANSAFISQGALDPGVALFFLDNPLFKPGSGS